MNNILIIDSSSVILRLGLICNNGVKSLTFDSQLKKHNSVLMPSVEQLLIDNNLIISDISAIACVVGPGSFTGIRLGVSTANGLAVGLNVPKIAINALEIISYKSRGKVMAAIDANHGNYYCGIYNDGIEAELINLTAQELEVFDGKVMYSSDSYIDSVADIARERFATKGFVNQLQPLYMKLSQAEREANENNKS